MGQTITVNRAARHEYFVLETYEAGIELVGTEVKSIRQGKVNLRDSYIVIKNGEAILQGVDPVTVPEIEKHAEWAQKLKEQYTFTEENAAEILRQEIGRVFEKVLEDAGVYKCTPEGREAFARFVNTVSAQ